MKRLRREWRAELFIIKPVCKTTTANCKTWQICSWSEKIMNLRKSFFCFSSVKNAPRSPISPVCLRLLRVSSCVYSLCLFTLSLSSYTRLYLHTFTPLLNVTPWVYTVPLSFHPSICQEDCGLNFRESHERWVGFRRVSPLEWANLNKKGLRKCQEIHLQRDGGEKRDCKTLEVMTVNVVRRCETVDSGTSFVFCFFWKLVLQRYLGQLVENTPPPPPLVTFSRLYLRRTLFSKSNMPAAVIISAALWRR